MMSDNQIFAYNKIAMTNIKNIFISIAVLWPAFLFSQTSFYVSSKGNDTYPEQRQDLLLLLKGPC
jgi:hypothetical protein